MFLIAATDENGKEWLLDVKLSDGLFQVQISARPTRYISYQAAADVVSGFYKTGFVPLELAAKDKITYVIREASNNA